jgi:hypothetical protein
MPSPSPEPSPPPPSPPSSPSPPPSPSPPTPHPADNTIPPAPPMSIHFPLACFKVICRFCLQNSHNISYRQCPDCYKKQGGMNYTDW